MVTTHEDNVTNTPSERRRSERTCAGCGQHAHPSEFVRLVLDPSTGEVAVDLASTSFGRGAHVHPSEACIGRSAKGGLARAFKSAVKADAKRIGEGIVLAADRRIEGLLLGARRAGQVAVGADTVVAVIRDGQARLVVVAKDASAAATLPAVEREIAAGRAIAFGDKAKLGALMARDVVAVIAVLNEGVASSIARAYQVSGPFRGWLNAESSTATGVGSSESGSREVTDSARHVGSEDAWSSEVR